jgi:hypothetical protein
MFKGLNDSIDLIIFGIGEEKYTLKIGWLILLINHSKALHQIELINS